MLLALLLILFTTPLYSEDYYKQGKRFAEEQEKKNSSPVESKEDFKKKIANFNPGSIRNDVRDQSFGGLVTGKCITSGAVDIDPEACLYVFVSFSIPETTLISLAKEVEKVRGTMVLRGLPGNSFKELAVQLYQLRKLGMGATVQVDPRLFIQYGVTRVPTFVVKTENKFDKLAGNVSLAFVLGKMENQTANELRKKL